MDIPRDVTLVANKCMLWKTKTRAEDNIETSKTIFACLGVRKIVADISIKTKPAKINQKLPISNIVPNKETSELEERSAERRKIRATPKPETNNQDFGKIIFPSINLAIAQKIIQAVNPKTKSKPFEVSTGKLVKGKQKNGNKTTTMNNDRDDNLSNIFERIRRLYYILIIKCNEKTTKQC
jgi:hypothetical protein